MKKRLIIIGIIVLLVVLVFKCIGKPIIPLNVARIELKTYSHTDSPGATQVVLSKDEVREVIRLYNEGSFAGSVTGEPCCDTYWLEIHLRDGTKIRVSEGNENQMIVKPFLGGRYTLEGKQLVEFILELVEEYEMASD